MIVVVAYDMPCNKRRSRLHKVLSGWLAPVQKSVFEGTMLGRNVDTMVREVERVIDPTVDAVRVYRLCRGCSHTLTLLGTSAPTPDPRAPLFV